MVRKNFTEKIAFENPGLSESVLKEKGGWGRGEQPNTGGEGKQLDLSKAGVGWTRRRGKAKWGTPCDSGSWGVWAGG